MKENNESKTTTLAIDKSTLELAKELREYSSEPLQGVVLRALKLLKESKSK
jgi:hypothetical protein